MVDLLFTELIPDTHRTSSVNLTLSKDAASTLQFMETISSMAPSQQRHSELHLIQFNGKSFSLFM